MYRLLSGWAARVRRTAANLRRDRGGTTGLAFTLMLSCSFTFIGAAVDLTRAYAGRTMLQTAVDHAALAGAAAYTDATQATNAWVMASNYLGAETSNGNDFLYLYDSGTFGGITNVLAVPGTLSNGQAGYMVTVNATGTLKTSFMALWTSSMTISVSATAANPIVTPTFSIGQFGASAADDNTAFAYPVPMSNGKPQYSQIPPVSQFYQVGRNNASFPTPTGQTFPSIAANQPIGFALQNITGGQAAYASNFPWWNCNNPGSNQYGVITGPGNNSGISGTGKANWFYWPFLMLGESPAQATNYSYSYTGYASGTCQGPMTIHTSTTYPTNTNCSFLIAQYKTGTTLATPPNSGTCFSPTGTPNAQLSAMSCQQFGGNTYAVWWNDMGGYTDDYDYNDAYFTVSCNTLTPTGATALTQVVLIK